MIASYRLNYQRRRYSKSKTVNGYLSDRLNGYLSEQTYRLDYIMDCKKGLENRTMKLMIKIAYKSRNKH